MKPAILLGKNPAAFQDPGYDRLGPPPEFSLDRAKKLQKRPPHRGAAFSWLVG